jgi:hypothetical protein
MQDVFVAQLARAFDCYLVLVASASRLPQSSIERSAVRPRPRTFPFASDSPTLEIRAHGRKPERRYAFWESGTELHFKRPQLRHNAPWGHFLSLKCLPNTYCIYPYQNRGGPKLNRLRTVTGKQRVAKSWNCASNPAFNLPEVVRSQTSALIAHACTHSRSLGSDRGEKRTEEAVKRRRTLFLEKRRSPSSRGPNLPV